MKRYWKIITLPLLIILTFGTLYVHQAVAKTSLPDMELVTLEGDSDVAEDMVLYGDYVDGPSHEMYRLTGDEVTYMDQMNYFERLNEADFYQSPELERLVKEEKGFMRGKELHEPQIYEDDEVIVYVGPYFINENDYEIDVEILERDRGETTSFTIKLPNLEESGYTSMMGVQYREGKLSLLVYHSYMDMQQVFAYEINSNEEALVDETLLAETDIHGHINQINSVDSTSKQDYWIFDIAHAEWDQELEFAEVTDEETLAYHLDTEKIIPVKKPGEWIETKQDYYISVGHGTVHYFAFNKEGLQIQSYDLAEEQMSDVQTLSLEEDILEGLTHHYPTGDELYFSSNVETGNGIIKMLYGIDLLEGTIHYEGELRVNDTRADRSIEDFEIYDIRFKS